SELVEAITGLRQAESGSIQLNGKDIGGLTIRERFESGIGHIPEDRQKRGLVLDYTLAENMVLEVYYRAPYSSGGILNKGAIRSYTDGVLKSFDVRSGQGAVSLTRSL